MTNVLYTPAGLMCMNCEFAGRDCSKLDFRSMKKISTYDDVVVVKCSEYMRKVDGGPEDKK